MTGEKKLLLFTIVIFNINGLSAAARRAMSVLSDARAATVRALALPKFNLFVADEAQALRQRAEEAAVIARQQAQRFTASPPRALIIRPSSQTLPPIIELPSRMPLSPNFYNRYQSAANQQQLLARKLLESPYSQTRPQLTANNSAWQKYLAKALGAGAAIGAAGYTLHDREALERHQARREKARQKPFDRE